MQSLGEILRKLRNEKGLSLRGVADTVSIDSAILSKIEHGQRKATRQQIVKLTHYYNADEDELMTCWLSEKMVYRMADEKLAAQAINLAERKIAYHAFKKIDRKNLIIQIGDSLGKFWKIQNAWIFGSFAREDDNPESDIDIAIKTEDDFSYFDLAEVKFELEKLVHRKVDVGFIDAFKPYILEHIKPDLQKIYERPPS